MTATPADVTGAVTGGTLEGERGRLRTNFVSDHPSSWFAALYQRDGLKGGHVIMLGPGNDAEARTALAAYPGGLQIGGGINGHNAQAWLDAGGSGLCRRAEDALASRS